MKPGTILRKFTAKDGREVILRTPKWGDLDDMLEFINSLVDEKAMIAMNQKQTREAETDWLAGNLTDLEKDNHVSIVAEVDGKMVANSELTPSIGYMSGIGTLGIAVRKGYREIGIGTEMLRELEKQAPRLGVEVIKLEVFEINSRAIHVYEKVGFEKTGFVPNGVRFEDQVFDSIIMCKQLQ